MIKEINNIIMSKEDLIAAIESRIDTIEGLLDDLEDNLVKVETFRDSLVRVED